ncbi:hypothetical protein FA13DRAFT_1708987 [Coprinellus micaceus]|uniref:Protein kinase domain-containing protein n=1 Tax=Coprinellus micaceus TaxID=71717 RepID=A0A4Y7TE17_COPMI|nr:hypothetical protein FA13DRAFT_1708987 [Coprinellus micaceus]
MDAWTPKAKDASEYVQECHDASANWHSLSSFFASQGYYLYNFTSIRQGAMPPEYPPPSVLVQSASDPYPYARLITTKNDELAFPFIQCMRVWPARDTNGREVILRQDPRNHTVPILDWLTHNDFVFAVMPRWDIIALARPEIFFRNVSELLDVVQNLLREFLHEKRVAHRDIYEQNMVMNVPRGHRRLLLGSQGTGEKDTDIRTVSIPRINTVQHRSMGLNDGPCNPFIDDVRSLAHTIERSIRHVEDAVPEIGAYFEKLVRGEDKSMLTASEALADLRGLRSRLSSSQLDHAPTGQFWYPHRITFLQDYKERWLALTRFKEGKAAITEPQTSS